jgi:hypothetical protein
VDRNGYGLRVPALVISPYARGGFVDHQVLSFDAYLKFIEDDFLRGQRLNPKTDGRPDLRPDVRENVPILGNLVKDFDFHQAPRPPIILPLRPHTDLLAPRPSLLGTGVRRRLSSLALRIAAAYLGMPPGQLFQELRLGIPLRRIARQHGRRLFGLRRVLSILAPGYLPRLQRGFGPPRHRRSRRR